MYVCGHVCAFMRVCVCADSQVMSADPKPFNDDEESQIMDYMKGRSSDSKAKWISRIRESLAFTDNHFKWNTMLSKIKKLEAKAETEK